MDTIEITLKIPNELVERAKQTGVLREESLVQLIEAEVTRREAGQRLLEMMHTLQSVEPPLTPEEIDAEIKAYRAEKATRRQNSQPDNQPDK
jgi:hypothetical protein